MMNKVFEKILDRLEELQNNLLSQTEGDVSVQVGIINGVMYSKKIVQEVAEEYKGGWVACSEKMPPVETEVFIVAKRKYCGGEVKYITTTAMYEDGTVLENDSCWCWQDIEGEWDEENDCYIIPEGWWENRHYNPDDVYNNAVDDEVVAWQPLPKPFKECD